MRKFIGGENFWKPWNTTCVRINQVEMGIKRFTWYSHAPRPTVGLEVILGSKILTVRCWKSHALRIFVATFGNMPRFFWFFFPFVSSSSSPVPSPDPTLALLASPGGREKKKKKTLNSAANWTSHWRLAKNLMRLRIFKQLNLFIGTFNDLANPSRATCPDLKVHKAPVKILTATTHEAEKRFTHHADSPLSNWMDCFSLWKEIWDVR